MKYKGGCFVGEVGRAFVVRWYVLFENACSPPVWFGKQGDLCAGLRGRYLLLDLGRV